MFEGEEDSVFKNRPIHILLVDDHASTRKALSVLLEKQTHFLIVGEAASGREAIDFCAKQKPHVILMDISMPGMNGIDAAVHIHNGFPEISVIGMSFDQHMRTAILQAGAAAFWHKLDSFDSLIKVICMLNLVDAEKATLDRYLLFRFFEIAWWYTFKPFFTLRESRRTPDPALPRDRSRIPRLHPWRLGSEALQLLQGWGFIKLKWALRTRSDGSKCHFPEIFCLP